MQHPNGFKFDFGSTVTILTTAVADTKHCRRVSGQGIFTGVVLRESEVEIKRSPKHVLISVDGLGKIHDDIKSKEVVSCCHENKNDCKGHQLQGVNYAGYKNEYEDEKIQEFVILSLTSPSFPFFTGQIVWVSLDQIIAWSILCSE
jgi:hypothetical protein